MGSDGPRSFSVEISAVQHYSEYGRHLINHTFEVLLAVDFTFLFTLFELQVAPPPSPADTCAWEDRTEWQTVADARLGHFYDAEFAITPYDPRSGQELRFASWHGTRGYVLGVTGGGTSR